MRKTVTAARGQMPPARTAAATNGRRVKKAAAFVGISAAAVFAANVANAADLPLPTKAWSAPSAPTACQNVPDFFLSSCLLSWYGVTFYGTVDMGGNYQTHATPFDPNFPTGASYLLQKSSRGAAWGLGPNGLSQSAVGVKVKENIGGNWSFVGNASLAFDPYSLKLANAPLAMQNAIGVPLNQQLLPVDSSKWGWLANEIYAGVSNNIWGTLTFGRQNTVYLDAINAYDPMGGSFAFSPIGYSGAACGEGDTEECRWTTAIKYRVNVGNFRFGVMGQPMT